MKNFDDLLNIVLEDSGDTEESSLIPETIAIYQELENTQQHILDLEYKLTAMKKKINASLALSIKRKLPNLNYSLDKIGCRIGYKTKSLIFNPNLKEKLWEVQSHDPKFSRSFINKYKHQLILSNSLNELIQSITAYFIDYYKSLNEQCNASGILLIEGKKSSLIDLISWGMLKPKINSRSSRHKTHEIYQTT